MLSSAARAMCPRVAPASARRACRAPAVPVRAPRPTNAGTEETPPAVGHRSGQGFDLGRRADQAQAVAQPLHRRAGDEDAAFERIFSRLADAARPRW